MTKQLTPLEALHNLVEQFAIKKYDLEGNLIYWENILDTMSKNGEYKIVETALKDYEKKLKVLEIFKKRIKIGGLNEDTTNAYYPYPECDFLHKQLTKEEYDLLKEVLK